MLSDDGDGLAGLPKLVVKAIPLGKWVKSIGKIRAQSKTSLEWEKPLRTTNHEHYDL